MKTKAAPNSLAKAKQLPVIPDGKAYAIIFMPGTVMAYQEADGSKWMIAVDEHGFYGKVR